VLIKVVEGGAALLHLPDTTVKSAQTNHFPIRHINIPNFTGIINL
jgi:hypothetical protein